MTTLTHISSSYSYCYILTYSTRIPTMQCTGHENRIISVFLLRRFRDLQYCIGQILFRHRYTKQFLHILGYFCNNNETAFCPQPGGWTDCQLQGRVSNQVASGRLTFPLNPVHLSMESGVSVVWRLGTPACCIGVRTMARLSRGRDRIKSVGF